jgi:hypothetical protein
LINFIDLKNEYKKQPAHIEQNASRKAHTAKTNTITLATTVISMNPKTAIMRVTKKPIRAAKIFGPASIGFEGNLSLLTKNLAIEASTLTLEFVKARPKKSTVKASAIKEKYFVKQAEVIVIRTKKATTRTTLSSIFLPDIGHNNSIWFLHYLTIISMTD